MFQILNSLKVFWTKSRVNIDNIIFSLHYKATAVVLLALSIFISSNQFIGDPIDCIIEGVPSNVIDTYCWIHGTFTVPEKKTNGKIGRDFIQPGVMDFVYGEDNIKFHKYYQWVCFVLFFQAMLFYLPGFLWKKWEDDRLKSLVQDLNVPILTTNCKETQKEMIINYFRQHFCQHNFYMWRFFICELLCIINVFSQTFFLNYFLDGEFITYGLNVLRITELPPNMRNDPMSYVFPKVTKCTFNNYGPSGSIQNHDGLCVLPLNFINEKIYVFLWFWFMILSISIGLMILYHILLLLVPSLRCLVFCVRTRRIIHGDIEYVLNKTKIGDWFLLSQLNENINSYIFEEIISELSSSLKMIEI